MRKYDFIALDCEKANNEPTSLCSIGFACFKNGKIVKQKEYIVQPIPCVFYKGIEISGKETYHGIPLDMYKNACTLNFLWPKIEKLISGEILVGHGINGDFLSIQAALNHFGIEFKIPTKEESICTNIASIYTYPECESHKLAALCEYLNIDIKPHHALSDAKACGYLLLEMLNDTDCSTAEEFIDICNKYNEIIIEKYTEKNISKYEDAIMDMFNFDLNEVSSIKHRNKQIAIEIIDYYKNRQNKKYKLPNIEIITCLTPIIEISKNEKYFNYFKELDKCLPFSKDSLLFIKNEDSYIMFIGILVDKIELIRNLLVFLARDKIKINENNEYDCIYRSFYKYLEATNILTEYLYINEDFEEYDVYEFIEFFFNTEVEKSKGYEYNKKYNLMIKNPNYEESYEDYLKIIKERMKMVAIYTSLQTKFDLFSCGLKIPNNIFCRETNLLLDIYNIFEHTDKEHQLEELTRTIKNWYNKNIY
jgi:DNA polymerase III epsilon subunit-like protein